MTWWCWRVAPSSAVHSASRDEVFLRVGDETRRLTFGQRRELLFDKGQAAYESEETRVTVAAVDADLLAGYAARLGAPDPGAAAHGGLSIDGHLTVAGCLLFAQEPGREFPNAHIRVSRFRGSQRGAESRRRCTARGSHPADPRAGPRTDREMAAHTVGARSHGDLRRRWSSAAGRLARGRGQCGCSPVLQRVRRSHSRRHLRHRIEIESLGRFPGLVDLAHPEHMTRFARNSRIARMC